MKTEIFYYSGTGFTLKAAKLAAVELGNDTILTPMVGALKREEKTSTAERAGLFIPMHAFGLPLACIEFLQEYSFPQATYIFSLVTRGGAPTQIHKVIDRYLKNQKKKLNAFGYATAPNTFDIVLKIHEDNDMTEARANFTNDIVKFAQRVKSSESFMNFGYRNRIYEYVVFPIMHWVSKLTGYFSLQKDFYVDNQCIGCGQCERVCLSEKINIKNGKPEWNGDVQCQYCFACIQLCPAKAIQIKKTKTPELDRIYCPNVNIREIAAQKQSI